MIKLFFLTVFLLMAAYPLKADQSAGDDQFAGELNNIKNPFEDGLPKPVVVIPKPVEQRVAPRSRPKPIPRPKPAPVQVVLPALRLQGVMVGEEMHEAIINDTIVPLQGVIDGAQVDSVSNQGVELSYKGKKFFLKVD